MPMRDKIQDRGEPVFLLGAVGRDMWSYYHRGLGVSAACRDAMVAHVSCFGEGGPGSYMSPM